ncbi:MAG: GIY-YIG nuclease family protein [Candidatus Shapirobacteria bacterium]|jgi:hypothetical protein
MDIKKFESKPLDWYLNHDIKDLNSNRRLIVKEMRVIILKKNIDSKNGLSYTDSIKKCYNHLYDKGYKKEFCDMIIYKIYPIFDFKDILEYISKSKNTKKQNEFKTYLFKDSKGRFKIGRSKNPYNRHTYLERINLGLKIIFIFDIDIENKLHTEYSKKLISNEWFNLTSKDLAKIYSDYNEYEIYLK